MLLHDPRLADLRHRIADIEANLIELARRRGQIQPKAKTNAVYLSRRKIDSPKRAKQHESTNNPSRAS